MITMDEPLDKFDSAQFRFYAELNDFLPKNKRKKLFSYRFFGKPSIKDAIEALGIPHTEVDLILVNGESVGFGYHLQNGDIVSVYPVFESFDISSITQVRKQPLRETAFVLDVHLGKLAKLLRMLGFDTLYQNNYDDPEIISISAKENRIILTRDVAMLKNGIVTHGYWVRATEPNEQLIERLRRFDLVSQINPFHRCMECNGLIKMADKNQILSELQENTKLHYDEFYKCVDCGRIYWKGSHYQEMKAYIKHLISTVSL